MNRYFSAHRAGASHLLILLGFALILFAVACSSGDEDSSPTAATTPTAAGAAGTPTTVVQTPVSGSPTPVVTMPPSSQTGISSVDAAIAAVGAKDGSKLASLISYESKGCTFAAGLGGPPACKPAEAEGTVVKVLYTSSCDGHYLRQDEVPAHTARFVEDRGRLAGVYRHNGLTFPASQYVAVFSFDTPYGNLARVLFISDNGVVGMTWACGSTAKEYVEAVGLREPIYLPGG